MAEFAEWPFWTPHPDNFQPALQGDISTDVAIIGGGFTGLNAAITLRPSGTNVVVLEVQFCGAGASGRNAGHLTPTISKDFPTLVKYFGEDKAVEFANFAERAVLHTESIINEHKIDCDYAPNGNVIAGVHPKHRKGREKMCEQAARLGINTTFLDKAEVRRRKLPPFVRFGALEGHGGQLNPGKYLAALRSLAIKKMLTSDYLTVKFFHCRQSHCVGW